MQVLCFVYYCLVCDCDNIYMSIDLNEGQRGMPHSCAVNQLQPTSNKLIAFTNYYHPPINKFYHHSWLFPETNYLSWVYAWTDRQQVDINWCLLYVVLMS